MAIVTSLHNPVVKLVRSLAERKHRQESGLFAAEGPKLLARASTEGWEPEYLLSTAPLEPWGKARILQVSDAVMAGLSGQRNPAGPIGAFRQRFLDALPAARPPDLWIALETLRDPGNLGTIVRTADAVAAKGVILVERCCDPYSREAVRASMGSIFGIPLLRMEAERFIAACAAWPGETVAAAASAPESFRRTYRGPVLLVMGSEGDGLSLRLSAACAVSVRIPMAGGAESLNVAAAAAVLLYEIGRAAL